MSVLIDTGTVKTYFNFFENHTIKHKTMFENAKYKFQITKMLDSKKQINTSSMLEIRNFLGNFRANLRIFLVSTFS